jgi:hypothetical protein
LIDDAELRIPPPGITLPVGILCKVGRRHRHRIFILQGIEGARGRISKLRVERHAIGPFRGDSEGAPDALPDSCRLHGVFLCKLSATLLALVMSLLACSTDLVNRDSPAGGCCHLNGFLDDHCAAPVLSWFKQINTLRYELSRGSHTMLMREGDSEMYLRGGVSG